MDSRIPRTWFLFNGWSSEFVVDNERYPAIQKMPYKVTLASLINARIFLVDSPLTLAHSQLAIEFSECAHPDESSCFQIAAQIVQKAISTFKQLLNSNTIDHFKELAEFTCTKENYIKTLVLRVSAREDSREYKIHLVPYFVSHAAECQKRFTDIHGDNQPGGLLAWLGNKETEIDKWKRENAAHIDDFVTNKWRLPELAKLLAQTWQS
jgi:hypothetical protein